MIAISIALAAAVHRAPTQPNPITQMRVVAEKRIRETLKDPYGAQIEWDGGLKHRRSFQFAWNELPVEGEQICGRINAKNSFGGFTGFRRFFVIFDDGDFKRFMIDNEAGQPAELLCGPWPR